MERIDVFPFEFEVTDAEDGYVTAIFIPEGMNGSSSSPSQARAPLDNFSAISTWGHTASCSEECLQFTRICPTSYMYAFYPQNFGWRYASDSRVEFHQAIDVSRASGTNQYNVFKGNETTVVNSGEYYK